MNRSEPKNTSSTSKGPNTLFRPLKKHRWKIVIAALLVVGGGWLALNSRWITPSPEYTVLQKEGAFEVREYDQLRLVRTEGGPRSNGAFMQLFGYISGENESEERFSMTTPVIMERDETTRSMAFIVDSETTPRPRSEAVRLHNVERGVFAVYRFKGDATTDVENEAEEALRAWMAKQSLLVEKQTFFAYYDPPWTPVWLRRNEVWLRVAEPPTPSEK